MGQAAAQVIMKYFTAEINAAVSDMSLDQMTALLRELEQSSFWIAILKYNNLRLLAAQSVVNSLDANAQATGISRAQGNMAGVVDLQNFIIQMVESEKQAQRDAEEIKRMASEE